MDESSDIGRTGRGLMVKKERVVGNVKGQCRQLKVNSKGCK